MSFLFSKVITVNSGPVHFEKVLEIDGEMSGRAEWKWGSEGTKRVDKLPTHPITKHVNVDIYIPITLHYGL